MQPLPRPAARWWRRRHRARRGRILAIKWGYNPNSSSLGVDVTFLLFGMLAVTLLTPLVAMALRARGWLGAAMQQPDGAAISAGAPPVADSPSGAPAGKA